MLEDFDVREAAGGARTAVAERFSVDVGSNGLVLEFAPTQGEALVSVIEIVPTEAAPASLRNHDHRSFGSVLLSSRRASFESRHTHSTKRSSFNAIVC